MAYRAKDTSDIQATWNSDDIQLAQIFQIKHNLIDLFSTKNLEEIYWLARALWRELDAKMTEKEQEAFQGAIKRLEDKRKELTYSENKIETEKEFYLLLEALYMDLCRMMKDHGLYFREQFDERGL